MPGSESRNRALTFLYYFYFPTLCFFFFFFSFSYFFFLRDQSIPRSLLIASQAPRQGLVPFSHFQPSHWSQEFPTEKENTRKKRVSGE